MDRSQATSLAATLPALPRADAFRQGLQLLSADFPELLLPVAAQLSGAHSGDARLAQLEGLAARSAGEGPQAYKAFLRAARLAPADPLIAHSHARTALEAGRPASALFENARRLAPADGTVLQGLAAALFAERKGEQARSMLQGVLSANPLWLDGHRTFAHIAGQSGENPLEQIDAALARHPRQAELHRLRIATLLEARRHENTGRAIALAQHALGPQPWLTAMAAHAASERGELGLADTLFADAGGGGDAGSAGLLVRHLIRVRHLDRANSVLDRWPLDAPDAQILWPYRALVWRVRDDPRAEWLEDGEDLVGIYDLADRIGDMAGLADHLRALHIASEAPLDQSVRGGTQTDGNLFLRDEKPIQALRSVILETVAQHIASLRPAQPGHPTRLTNREPLRFAGSWSVRLRDAGFHSDHVHSHGWLSSAFYVALPEVAQSDADRDPHAGWLTLGECRELIPDLPPRRFVEPLPGRLVLFPSTMWHGTRPFPAGERLTVAFDIARPKQDPIPT